MNKKGEVKVSIVQVDGQYVTDNDNPLHDNSDDFHNQNPKSVLAVLS